VYAVYRGIDRHEADREIPAELWFQRANGKWVIFWKRASRRAALIIVWATWPKRGACGKKTKMNE